MDLSTVCLKVLQEARSVKAFSMTYVILIPKVDCPRKVIDFLPY